MTAACVGDVFSALQAQAFCAMAAPVPEEDGALAAQAEPRIESLLRGKQAAVAGPGLSQRPGVGEALRALIQSDVPKVLDADALNVMAAARLLPGRNTVVTPHPGEAGRLLETDAAQVLLDPVEAAKALAQKTGAVALLKGCLLYTSRCV